jgi:hypothetical protein
MIRYSMKIYLKLVCSILILSGVKQILPSFKFVFHGFESDMVSKMLVLCCTDAADFPKLHLVFRTEVV